MFAYTKKNVIESIEAKKNQIKVSVKNEKRGGHFHCFGFLKSKKNKYCYSHLHKSALDSL